LESIHIRERIAILGGGPSALFMYKRFVDSGSTDLEIHIHEAGQLLGAGMPYSLKGAGVEHVTNVSDTEVPQIVTSIHEWVKTVPEAILQGFGVDKERFNEYNVLPRLLFGQYLSAQFDLLLRQAEEQGLPTKVHLSSKVDDIIDRQDIGKVDIQIEGGELHQYDRVIICTGHNFPCENEKGTFGFFDSPYPPAKLRIRTNHPVAIKGSSLTAIDAIRTLARSNGQFEDNGNGYLTYRADPESEDFRLVLHSRAGLLPAIRFHLEEPLLSTDMLLSPEELSAHMAENDGFISLDYVFEKNFKDLFQNKDPGFYQQIKDMSLEDFVQHMMRFREEADPFVLFRAEFMEAEKSIKRQESIHWKEMLAVLSYALNYPAKYLPAEDMIRMQKVLMPLVSIVIAFAPQSSARELLALYQAERLSIISVDADSSVEPQEQGGILYHYTDQNGEKISNYFQTFVNSTGQPHLNLDAFPFQGLVHAHVVSSAKIKFKSGEGAELARAESPEKVQEGEGGQMYLKAPGITINDCFQVIDPEGRENERVYIMAVPYIGGYNPDYSGLDFCEEASGRIIKSIISRDNSELASIVDS
jgi:uncharacterized NAD(P)/FAD-binding protein YdhS